MPELKKAMINVIKEGTAKIVHRSDMDIAAKTGTAQVGSKEHRRQIAWLCGYFPADDPKYSFAVMVEGTFAENHGSGLEDGLLGGRDAGKIVKEILNTVYGAKGSTTGNDDDDSSAKTDAGAAADDDDDNSTPAPKAAPVKTPAPKPAAEAPAAKAPSTPKSPSSGRNG